MKSKKILRYIIFLVVIGIIVLSIGKKKGWFGPEYRIKVAVEKGEKRDIVEIITANGKIQPETEVKLSADVSGEIVELDVKEGDLVNKGDFLLKIKPDNYISSKNRAEATLNSTKARLTQAEAQLEQARLEFNRRDKLFKQEAISEAEYEQALTSYNTALAETKAAEYSVASANASLREAEENLRKTNIFAPMSGTISKLNVELGERVVGTELMSGTEILRVADLNRMEVEVEVNENDIVRVHLGDTALIEVDAYLGRKFKALVTEIPVSANTAGITTDQVTNFNVKILLLPESYFDLISDRNKSPFRPGMSATADIQTSRASLVYSIPIQAVTTRPDTAEIFIDPTAEKDDNTKEVKKDELVVVFVNQSDTARLKIVETGIQDDQYIQIKSGLEEDDDIIVAPYSAVSKKIENNNLLEVVEKKDLFKDEKKKK
jgi:HlyD family secretion protein